MEGRDRVQEITEMAMEIAAQLYTVRAKTQTEQDIAQTLRLPMEVEQDFTYTFHHPAYLLRDALRNALGKSVSRRPPTQQQFEPIVTAPFVSVGSRVVYVLRGLVSGRLSKLKQLIGKNVGKSQTVATFLAVLELIRGGRVTIEPDESIALISRRKKE